MGDDASAPFRRWARREYLRKHGENRRAADREAGARRIDVTLKGDMLDDFETVRRYVRGFNRKLAEIAERNPNTALIPIRLSDTEIIRVALSRAASAIQEDDEQLRKQGLPPFSDVA